MGAAFCSNEMKGALAKPPFRSLQRSHSQQDSAFIIKYQLQSSH